MSWYGDLWDGVKDVGEAAWNAATDPKTIIAAAACAGTAGASVGSCAQVAGAVAGAAALDAAKAEAKRKAAAKVGDLMVAANPDPYQGANPQHAAALFLRAAPTFADTAACREAVRKYAANYPLNMRAELSRALMSYCSETQPKTQAERESAEAAAVTSRIYAAMTPGAFPNAPACRVAVRQLAEAAPLSRRLDITREAIGECARRYPMSPAELASLVEGYGREGAAERLRSLGWTDDAERVEAGAEVDPGARLDGLRGDTSQQVDAGGVGLGAMVALALVGLAALKRKG